MMKVNMVGDVVGRGVETNSQPPWIARVFAMAIMARGVGMPPKSTGKASCSMMGAGTGSPMEPGL